MAESGGLFAPIGVGDELLTATSDRAWLRAMLDTEAALAMAQADVGLIPMEDAVAIARICGEQGFDVDALGRSARLGGNPVIPLVAALRERAGAGPGDWVHWGATSQDILDTAAMLVADRSIAIIERDLERLKAGCALLADSYRNTLMVGRTLLQPAVPITFGLKAAGWLSGAVDAHRQLAAVRSRLAVQLGGAAGTLASLGEEGPTVLSLLAQRVGLSEPSVPWHTARQRVAELGAALGVLAGTAAKIATDVALMMQSEIGEVSEPASSERGGSSTLPQKHNPVGAATVRAAATRAHALVPVLFSALVAEHERPVGAWQAEWETLGELLRLAGGAIERAAEMVDGLEVDTRSMDGNLRALGGLVLAERVALAATATLGRARAMRLVQLAASRVASGERTFMEAIAEESELAGALASSDVASLLDPATYLGSTSVFIDRALTAYRQGGSQP